MGYLSGPSPHIKSGAVSVLSGLVYNNADICLLIPDLVPSVLALLRTKAVEVIKAVLGFLKVLVSCHQAKDLQNLLPDIVNGILPWSSVSRHHFRTKALQVTVILEILIRRCGSAPVKLLTPEKHRNFCQNRFRGTLSSSLNRHGKNSSKETGASDPNVKVLESSPRGRQRKREHEESSILPEDHVGAARALVGSPRMHKGLIWIDYFFRSTVVLVFCKNAKNEEAWKEKKVVSVDYDKGKHNVIVHLSGLRKEDVPRRYRLRVEGDRFQKDWAISKVVRRVSELDRWEAAFDIAAMVVRIWIGRYGVVFLEKAQILGVGGLGRRANTVERMRDKREKMRRALAAIGGGRGSPAVGRGGAAATEPQRRRG
ncbi:ARM repeat superfamily protein [Actinidia rufa]|uniref:ARM repeat superfamily protein n=1 Tax=Actinidia rufa TaxID=165716 RepID=A0A7J0FHQ5_9ERIC|nr:ARM repeat superfamily protein [Actinidia rufa]